MLVETYEALEVDCTGEVESNAEALELIEKLGLEGQQGLMNPDTKERFPYRKMTDVEAFVYTTLLPKKSKPAAYKDGPIPLRVLQVMSHATGMFTRLEIWSPKDADVKDPVLVGCQGTEYSYERFILARWGEVLEPLDALARMAAKIHRNKITAACKEISAKALAKVAAFDAMSDDEIVNGDRDIPVAYHI